MKKFLLLLLMISFASAFSFSSAQAKTLEADVVIVGGGTAGMPAAVAAAENGASVIVFEKTNVTGGCGNRGMGLFAVESWVHRENNDPLTRDKAFEVWMDFVHWSADARLIRAYIDKSAGTIDWLTEMGVTFKYPPPAAKGHYNTGIFVIADDGHTGANAMSAAMNRLAERAEKLGVKVLLETPVSKILKENGRIVGVVAKNKSGDTIEARAKAVIVCTGGFGANPEWIEKYTGLEWGKDIVNMRIPGLTGDGIRMAWEVGAMKGETTMQATAGAGGGGAGSAGALFGQAHNLMVNVMGERFINEYVAVTDAAYMANALFRQKDKTSFMIFDETIKDYHVKNGLEFVSPVFPARSLENVDTDLEKVYVQGSDRVFIGNALEELAAKSGIDLEGLKKTVDEYNKACEAGRDPLFNKDPKYLKPIEKPRFYASKGGPPGGYGSLGGIRVNYRLEVLGEDFRAIAGLYAAGTDANETYAGTYIYPMAGNTMGFAINSGRMAGESAAQYVKKMK